jgi:predicted HTH transcriptional regulator
MLLFEKPLHALNEADLVALVHEREPEGKTLDYKPDAVGRTDEAKKEFLYDVTSFANSAGGHLIFGIEEQAGAPTVLVA